MRESAGRTSSSKVKRKRSSRSLRLVHSRGAGASFAFLTTTPPTEISVLLIGVRRREGEQPLKSACLGGAREGEADTKTNAECDSLVNPWNPMTGSTCKVPAGMYKVYLTEIGGNQHRCHPLGASRRHCWDERL